MDLIVFLFYNLVNLQIITPTSVDSTLEYEWAFALE